MIEAYRESVRRRYEAQSVRREAGEALLGDRQIESLRDLFLEHLYPPAAQRQELDQAFACALALARSPIRLLGLTGPALRGLARLGRRTHAAMATGAATLDAHRQALGFESRLTEAAASRGLLPDQLREEARFAEVIVTIPEGEVLRFRRQLIVLISRLADVKMLEATRDLFAHCLETMERRPQTYGAAERAGFAMGRRVLTAGLELFRDVDPAVVPPMLQVIDRIERRWYEQIKAQAATQPPRR